MCSVFALASIASAQSQARLFDALLLTHAQEVGCSAGLERQGYRWCAAYPFPFEVMVLDLLGAFESAGVQAERTTDTTLRVTLTEGVVEIDLWSGFAAMRERAKE